MNLMVKCEGLSDPHCFWTFSSFLQKKTGGLFVASCLPFRYHVFADNDTKGVQMNNIINLLGLEDETVKIIDVSIADGCHNSRKNTIRSLLPLLRLPYVFKRR